MNTVPTDFYCSEKFTWLSVDLEKRQWFSCCGAAPQNIDLLWLKNNPGQLFNLPALAQERQQMLDGQRVTSCEAPCWSPEQRNLTSKRMTVANREEKFNQVKIDSPRNLGIVLGSTCNMTCSYCCKNYSSAWLRDIADHGSYGNIDRFNLNDRDRLLLKISQPEHKSSQGFQTLLDELYQLKIQDKIYISGGETFLYNNFVGIVNNFTENNDVVIHTGLGVDPQRFRNQLLNLAHKNRVTIYVSAENCDNFYEFNRFGNSWQTFQTNLAEVGKQGFTWHFASVLSNLTVFGFETFVQKFPGKHIRYEFCNEPDFLNINILDDISKDRLAQSLTYSGIPFRDVMIKNMMNPVTDDLRKAFSKYVLEFAKRRSLDLSIYPDSFVTWIYDTH